MPSGGLRRTTLRRFFGSSPALASARSLSITCSGACTTTRPMVSNPARPARPAIWWNSRAISSRVFVPSYFDSAVNSTVRIGTLMPTPRVSVPQMTFSSPACASVSTSRRYFGSMPAWCTPMPCRTSRDSVLPKPGANRKLPDQLGDRVLLGPAAHVDAHQRLGLLDRRGLGEVHDVDRRLVRGEQLGHGLVQRRHGERERQRDRPLGRADHGGRPAGPAGQVALEPADVAERRRHQHELGLRQLDQRHLPGPAAIRVGVEVELVHDDLAGVGVGAVPQRDVGQHLGGAADDRRVRRSRCRRRSSCRPRPARRCRTARRTSPTPAP